MNSTPRALRSLLVLRLIAVFKFAKALFVIAAGFGLLSFFNPSVSNYLYGLLDELPYQFEQRLLHNVLDFLSGLSPIRLRTFAMATFAYAGLFLVEGIGLWQGLHWAEVLTLIATSTLIPVELYELSIGISFAKIMVLVLNLMILGYLIMRLRRERAWAHKAQQ